MKHELELSRLRAMTLGGHNQKLKVFIFTSFVGQTLYSQAAHALQMTQHYKL